MVTCSSRAALSLHQVLSLSLLGVLRQTSAETETYRLCYGLDPGEGWGKPAPTEDSGKMAEQEASGTCPPTWTTIALAESV